MAASTARWLTTGAASLEAAIGIRQPQSARSGRAGAAGVAAVT